MLHLNRYKIEEQDRCLAQRNKYFERQYYLQKERHLLDNDLVPHLQTYE